MEVIGFIFGLAGLSFAIRAGEKVASLKKEFDEMKKSLEGAGVLKEQGDSEDK